jgi:hypothetical protein
MPARFIFIVIMSAALTAYGQSSRGYVFYGQWQDSPGYSTSWGENRFTNIGARWERDFAGTNEIELEAGMLRTRERGKDPYYPLYPEDVTHPLYREFTYDQNYLRFRMNLRWQYAGFQWGMMYMDRQRGYLQETQPLKYMLLFGAEVGLMDFIFLSYRVMDEILIPGSSWGVNIRTERIRFWIGKFSRAGSDPEQGADPDYLGCKTDFRLPYNLLLQLHYYYFGENHRGGWRAGLGYALPDL